MRVGGSARDSGQTLSSHLPTAAEQYSVALFSLDASMKYLGWSLTAEYYSRNISDFVGIGQSSLFDHGFCWRPAILSFLRGWSFWRGDRA